MTPRRLGRAVGDVRYTPTFAGTSQFSRVRSPLIAVQVKPAFVVFQSVFEAKNSVLGSTGENRSGCVRTVRWFGPGDGAMLWTCPVRRSNRVTLPPYTMSGSPGSGATKPYSSTPTGVHSRKVICPLSPRLETHADPLSCWPPH